MAWRSRLQNAERAGQFDFRTGADMMSSLGSDFFAGGALGAASSAALSLRGARRGIPGPPVSEGGFVRPSATCQLWRPKGRAAFQTSSDRPVSVPTRAVQASPKKLRASGR